MVKDLRIKGDVKQQGGAVCHLILWKAFRLFQSNWHEWKI